MRNRVTEASIILMTAMLLVGWTAVPSPAQKLRERGTDTLRSISSDDLEQGPSDIVVQIKTGRGDSSRVVVRSHGKDWGGQGADIVRMGEDITIDPDQVVNGDVVAIGGTVHVLGHVRGDVVAVGGSVDLKSTAVVDGDAVSIGGGLEKEPGARVGGQNVGMHFGPSMMWRGIGRHEGLRPLFTLFTIAVVFLLLFFVGWLLNKLAGTQMAGIGGYMQGHLWRSLLIGVIVHVLYPAALVIACVTVVGIPLALLSIPALILTMIFGFVAVAGLVGMRLGGTSQMGGTPAVNNMALLRGLGLFLGFLLVARLIQAAGGFFHMLGLGLLLFWWVGAWLASSIGLGSILMTRFGHRSGVQPAQPVPPGQPLPSAQPLPPAQPI